jgi:hypothetical protein
MSPLSKLAWRAEAMLSLYSYEATPVPGPRDFSEDPIVRRPCVQEPEGDTVDNL